MTNRDCDVVIIGGGPSGSTAAALIKKAGYTPLVVEQASFPRFVIGESLLPRCMDLLNEAGMLEDVEQRGYLVKNGAVFRRDNDVCNFNFGERFSEGWDYTFQVPREDFDLTLAQSAEKKGVEILWESTVTAVDFSTDSQHVTVVDKSGTQLGLRSKFIFDASGYGRVLPRLLGLEKGSTLPERQSIFTHITGDIRPTGKDEGKIWICILPENSWLWIIPFSNGKTSIGLVARPDYIERLPGDNLDEKLHSALLQESSAKDRLRSAEFTFPVMSIRGYSAAVKQFTGKGYALLGNATEFLDPVFSSGVTLALESSNRAAKTLIRQFSGEDIDWDKEYTEYMSIGIETFRTYVNGWYDDKLSKIFFSKNQPETIRNQICSVLAGYVWDTSNPYVRDHERAVNNLSLACSIQNR